MANISTVAQAETMSLAIKTITGVQPVINYTGENAEILFNKSDIPALQTFIKNQMAKKQAVRINFLPVVAPIALKIAAPYLAAAIVVIYLAGRNKLPI
jgi:hypothetical protein